MMFLSEASPFSKPILTVNWWGFNNPASPYYGPEDGKREAANWVEYCNGLVTAALLEQAENWQPSKFVDEFEEESTEVNAVEWANGTTCWRSWEQAPKGYFAWLRYHFALQRGLSEEQAKVPYGVQYWEIGNEIPYYYPRDCSNDFCAEDIAAYRNGIIDYSEVMKRANDVSGSLDENKEEVNPYGGSKIRIGAVMDDLGNWLTTYPRVSSWDTGVLNSNSVSSIDFIVSHLYVTASSDHRFSREMVWGGEAMPGETGGPPVQPTVSLSDGSYTFRVRAKGKPNGVYHPRMSAWLIPESGNAIQLSASDDPRHYGDYEVNVENETYTTYGNGSSTRTDYVFKASIAEGNYQPWLKMSYDPGDPAFLAALIMSYQADGEETETIMEFRPAADQEASLFAAPKQLGGRIADLRAYANSLGKTIEVAVSEYGQIWGDSAFFDQARNLKATITIADLLRELMSAGVSITNFWHLQSRPSQVVQKDDTWDGIKSTWCEDSGPEFRSASQPLFELLSKHYGDIRLTTEVVSAPGEEFTSPEYLPIPASQQAMPYITALATGSDLADGYVHKIYVLVINKSNHTISYPVTLNDVGADPSSMAWHTLQDTVASDPGAQNSSAQPERVSLTAVGEESLPQLQDGTLQIPAHDFPAYSVTVLEVQLDWDVACLGNASAIADGWRVALADDILNQYVVTAKFGDDRFYIEDEQRTAGIAVLGDYPSVSQGRTVQSVRGWLTTTADGERGLTNGTFELALEGPSCPGPLGMRNEWLGGMHTGNLVPDLKDAFGFYNVGMLVQTWGKLTATGSGWFYIDDGSGLGDGSGFTGVRVVSSASPPGTYLRVIGFSSAQKIADQPVRILRERGSQGDLSSLSGGSGNIPLSANCWNAVSLPGIPIDPIPEQVFVGNPPGIELFGNLQRYDAASQQWITYYDCTRPIWGNCLMAEGYMLYIPTGGSTCYDYSRAPVTGDQLINLPSGSVPQGDFSLIGNPFTADKEWRTLRVTDGVDAYSLAEVTGASGLWIHEIQEWNGSAWVQIPEEDLCEDGKCMVAGKAYKIFPKVGKLALIVPE